MLPVIAIAIMVLLDQLVKLWAINVLESMERIPLLGDVFQLLYIENRGAAFSILQNQRLFFLISTVLIVGVIVYTLRAGIVQTALGRWSLYLIIGGAIGNWLDRLLRGFVVDMFYFKLIDFPVFNVADVFVCVGAALFIFYVMVQHKDGTKGEESEDA